MADKIIRWGIIGAGIIAHKMAEAVELDADSDLVAVASRTTGKAQAFADLHQIDAYDDYESLLIRDDIDVIYVATTHNFHFDNALLALEHNKHIVVEKPFTVNAMQAKILVELAREKSRFLMEAVWVRFLPSMLRLKKMLKEGVIGEVKLFNISFGGIAPAHYLPRLIDPHLAGGVTLDMGIYPITFVNYLLDEMPFKSKSFCRMSHTDVDELAVYQLQFPSGCLAVINTSFNLHTKNEALIYGSEGYIDFPNFQEGSSFTLHTHSGTRTVEKTETISEDNHPNGFVYQVAEVARCLRAGLTESAVMPADETIATMVLMDSMRTEWAFKYPFE